MKLLLPRLRLPFFHRNGVAPQIEQEIFIHNGFNPVEPETTEPEVFLKERPQLQVLGGIRELKELLESQTGVGKAQVSFKTAKNGTQLLKIFIISTNRGIRPKQKRKLIARLADLVARRVDISPEQIFFEVQKAPKETSIW